MVQEIRRVPQGPGPGGRVRPGRELQRRGGELRFGCAVSRRQQDRRLEVAPDVGGVFDADGEAQEPGGDALGGERRRVDQAVGEARRVLDQGVGRAQRDRRRRELHVLQDPPRRRRAARHFESEDRPGAAHLAPHETQRVAAGKARVEDARDAGVGEELRGQKSGALLRAPHPERQGREAPVQQVGRPGVEQCPGEDAQLAKTRRGGRAARRRRRR